MTREMTAGPVSACQFDPPARRVHNLYALRKEWELYIFHVKDRILAIELHGLLVVRLHKGRVAGHISIPHDISYENNYSERKG
jgi:hypothetical protein